MKDLEIYIYYPRNKWFLKKLVECEQRIQQIRDQITTLDSCCCKEISMGTARELADLYDKLQDLAYNSYSEMTPH